MAPSVSVSPPSDTAFRIVDLANAVKADKERGKEAKPEKKPSIRAQLRADKEKAQKKNAKQKLQDLERS